MLEPKINKTLWQISFKTLSSLFFRTGRCCEYRFIFAEWQKCHNHRTAHHLGRRNVRLLTAQPDEGHTLCSFPIDHTTATDWLIHDNQILCYAIILLIWSTLCMECTPNEGIKLLIDDSDCDIFDHCMILCEDIDCWRKDSKRIIYMFNDDILVHVPEPMLWGSIKLCNYNHKCFYKIIYM